LVISTFNVNFLISTLEFQRVFFTVMAMSISFILDANFNQRYSTQQKKKRNQSNELI